MMQFMWQADLHGVAQLVTDCLHAYYNLDLVWVKHLVSPRWVRETLSFFLSFSLACCLG